MSHYFVVPVDEVVRSRLHCVVLHQVSHVSIFEQSDFAADALSEVEQFMLFLWVCRDFIIVYDMEVCCFL